MIASFLPLKAFLESNPVSIDNNTFKLHYKYTVVMLLICLVMVSSKQFFGAPIHCIGDNSGKRNDAIDNFCWVYGTYTIKKHLNGITGHNVAHAGIGPHVKTEDEEIHHVYYQWVCFVLLFQAVFFYMPYALWSYFEGGKIKSLTEKLNTAMLPDLWNNKAKQNFCKYLLEDSAYLSNYLAYQFAFCEILNLLNVILQMYVLDIFLGRTFYEYGTAVAAFQYTPTVSGSVDPMARAFPKVTRCTFHHFGSSGSLQNTELLCILPINIINEKIFVLIWFWFHILTVVSACAVICRVALLRFSWARKYIIRLQACKISPEIVKSVVNHFRLGDWFLLQMLGKNLNPMVFRELVIELHDRINEEKGIIV